MLALAGVLSLCLGVVLLAVAARMLLDGSPAFLILLIPGICAMVFGAAAFLNPGLILAFIAVILGFVCLTGGLAAAGAGIFREAPPAGRILPFAGGCLVAVLGMLILLRPAGAAELAARLAGLLLAALGFILLAPGILNHRKRDPLEHPEYRVIEEK